MGNGTGNSTCDTISSIIVLSSITIHLASLHHVRSYTLLVVYRHTLSDKRELNAPFFGYKDAYIFEKILKIPARN